MQVESISDTSEIETAEDHGVLHIEHEIKTEPETITTETDDSESNVNLKLLCKYKFSINTCTYDNFKQQECSYFFFLVPK